MFVIKPETRKRWETTLHREHSVDEETARTIVDWVVSNPRVVFARPKDEADLESIVNHIEDSLDEIELTDFGEIQDQAAVRNELIGTLRADLGLIDFDGSRIGAPPQARVFGSKRPQAAEPPDHLKPFIDQFEDLIEDEESAFEFNDLVEIVQWVGYRTDTDTQE